jgi:hypothetical protein
MLVYFVGPDFTVADDVLDYDDLDSSCLYAIFSRTTATTHIYLWVGADSGVDPHQVAEQFEAFCESALVQAEEEAAAAGALPRPHANPAAGDAA